MTLSMYSNFYVFCQNYYSLILTDDDSFITPSKQNKRRLIINYEEKKPWSTICVAGHWVGAELKRTHESSELQTNGQRDSC